MRAWSVRSYRPTAGIVVFILGLDLRVFMNGEMR
jgi:hypothetical protein